MPHPSLPVHAHTPTQPGPRASSSARELSVFCSGVRSAAYAWRSSCPSLCFASCPSSTVLAGVRKPRSCKNARAPAILCLLACWSGASATRTTTHISRAGQGTRVSQQRWYWPACVYTTRVTFLCMCKKENVTTAPNPDPRMDKSESESENENSAPGG
ncbi:hypothetical protein CALCODRAFT_379610 [Calocera cornea HHB12733]|uniref:Uncharacterized protein n=1 Tax=Calocera cornea HHB12733 TaxID=1353952 RepID=A0A165EDW1_9BASI|nr:hypothetical protein CALCODRAFT_379610 [Calocera cornea HHB12733]